MLIYWGEVMLETKPSRDEIIMLFKLLSSDARLSIMKLLQRQECCVCELTAALEMTQPAISQHLKKLREGGLIIEERRGQWIYYQMNQSSPLHQVLTVLLNEVPESERQIEKMETNAQC
ncbi:Transcriptional repressor SmtB like protein [Lentibacillus sp. JNUCC-1]|uniref:ArsR/SmtB family transcription factor n=1 Tax=Lentibacillus sp. JNUCC-1 TaxID=2654513 RepID=UPI0012E8B6B4|nr:metalloregulator ArsR/SmtB family transcription factor [Lentibacillus sp. JNUCC-1]MUV38469.1 Transcriptional repressor SmtB like protein [Lentibacillus sp. JNUCC-1]